MPYGETDIMVLCYLIVNFSNYAIKNDVTIIVRSFVNLFNGEQL